MKVLFRCTVWFCKVWPTSLVTGLEGAIELYHVDWVWGLGA